MSVNFLKLLTPIYFIFFSVYPYLHLHVGCHHGVEVCAHVEADDHRNADNVDHDHCDSHIHFRGDWSHLFVSKNSLSTFDSFELLPDFLPPEPSFRDVYLIDDTVLPVFLTKYSPALRRAPPLLS